jgi:hypothetical protein
VNQPLTRNLTPEKALIFRITHRDNIPWILANGLHCRNSGRTDPNFVSIGNPDLIDKRQTREVPIGPKGTLSDYVPFYFTPYSPMMYNIRTGWGGITRRANEEIVVIVSSLRQAQEQGLSFVFADRHAYLRAARFFDSLDDLGAIDFELLQRKDFKKDPDDPEKVERYQAEALIHRCLPMSAARGIACYDPATRDGVRSYVEEAGLSMKVLSQPSWYFR